MARPTKELEKLLTGKMEWNEAPEWLKSWATFYIWQAAVNFITSSKQMRRKIFEETPVTLKPELEAMIKSIADKTKQPPQ